MVLTGTFLATCPYNQTSLTYHFKVIFSLVSSILKKDAACSSKIDLSPENYMV
jgi:hypothetical protein